MNAENLGAFLREYRKRRGLKIKEVQQIFLDNYDMRVSEKTIYNWESQQYCLSVPKLLALCEIYEINDLNDDLPSDADNLSITKKEWSIIQAYRKNTDLQHAVDRILGLPD